MKKTLFALEVLFMLSALPVFCGLAMGRKTEATEKVQPASSSTRTDAVTKAITAVADAAKNS